MHLVQRAVGELREQTLHFQSAEHDAERVVVAERHQRPEIAISEAWQRRAAHPGIDNLDYEIGLLLRGLGVGRRRLVRARQCAGGAVADRKYIIVAGRLQRWTHDEAIDLST